MMLQHAMPAHRGPPWRDRFAGRNWRDALLFGMAILLIAGTLAGMLHNIRRVSQSNAAVAVSHRIIGASDQLQALLRHIETSQRGYRLTGEPTLLMSSRVALAGIAAQRQTLAMLVSDPAQRARLDAVDRGIENSLGFAGRMMALAAAGEAVGARAIDTPRIERRTVDPTRRAFEAFRAGERALLGSRRQEAQEAERRALLYALGAAFVTLLAACLALIVLRRKNADMARRSQDAARSTRRFKATFDQAAVGIAHLAPNGVVIRANPQLCEIAGRPCEQLIGHSFDAFTHPDDIAQEQSRRQALLSGKQDRYASEYRCVRADGSPLWISVTISLVRDEHGAPDLFLVIAKDIAERKRAEAQLLSGEAQYRAIHDSAIEAIAVIDASGRIQSVNPATRRIFGYENREMIGQNVSMLMPGAMASAHDDHLDRYRRTGKRAIIGIGREVEGRRKDGSVFPLDLSVAEWQDGGVTFFTGIMRDITTRKQAETELAEGEARFRLTQEAVRAGNWETDLVTLRTTLSRESMRLFGVEQSASGSFAQGELTALADPVDAARMRGQFERSVAEGKRLDAIMRIALPNGQSHWIQLIGQPQYDEAGMPLRMTGLIIDVTERRKIQLALRESEEKLRSLQNDFAHLARVNELGELAAAIAHEINQPLTAITNYMNVGRLALAALESGEGDTDAARTEAREVTELAAAQALRAGEIVRRLRSFVAKGTGARRAEPIDEIVDTAMALSLVDAQLAGIIVDRHGGAGQAMVNVEAIQIQQVLVNLLRNAIDALVQLPDADLRQLTIATKLLNAGETVEVMVRDSGPGILPEVLARLFEPFVTSKADGMGMGLSLSRRLIEAHGGSIEVESLPGRGATFRFSLPVMRSDRSDG